MGKIIKRPRQLSLEKTGEKYFALVQSLKKNLILGQVGFIRSGRDLYRLKNETFLKDGKKVPLYQAEDISRKISWEEFCSRPDLPFPTSSKNVQSIRRMADRMIKVYSLFRKRFGVEETRLTPIGYTKLTLLAPVLKDKKKGDPVIENWLETAGGLNVPQLIAEIISGDKSLADLLECTHPEDSLAKVEYWKCGLCGIVWKNKPERKKKVKKLWEERDELIGTILEKTGLQSLGEPVRKQRDYANRLIQKYGKEETLACIDWLLEDKFWKDKLNKMSTIFYQMPRFLRESKVEAKLPDYVRKYKKKKKDKTD